MARDLDPEHALPTASTESLYEWRQTPFLFFGELLLIPFNFLWLFITPVLALVWLIGWPFWRNRDVQAWKLFGWVDLNVAASLQRTLLRPFVKSPVAFAPVHKISDVTHRVRWGGGVS